MTNYPTSLDTFNNPGATDTMDAAGLEHDAQHANLNDAVAALQAKVGITNSAVTTSFDYRIRALEAGGGGGGIVFGAGAPDVSVTAPAYWDTTGKALWINDPNDGWDKILQL